MRCLERQRLVKLSAFLVFVIIAFFTWNTFASIMQLSDTWTIKLRIDEKDIPVTAAASPSQLLRKSFRAIQAEFQQELEDGPYIAALYSEMMKDTGYPAGLTKVLDFLYLGGFEEANNLEMLQKAGITHVINCAESYVQTYQKFYGDGMKYYGFEAEDNDDYDIMQHFEPVYKIIDEARTSGGKVLIHCIMGINRSAALTVAYCMLHKNLGPIGASKLVRKARCHILSNDAFQRQLIRFGRQHNMLHLDDPELQL